MMEADLDPNASIEGVAELRVLSGLQAGAALPADGALIVGAGDEADLLLIDEGVAPAQLRLERSHDGGLVLVALADGVRIGSDARLAPGDSRPLAVGDAFCAGPVWLMVRDMHDAWDAWQPPATSDTAAVGSGRRSGDEMTEESTPGSVSDADHEFLDDDAADGHTDAAADADVDADVAVDVAVDADAALPLVADPTDRDGVRRVPARQRRWSGVVIVLGGLVSTLVGVAVLLMQLDRQVSPAADAGRNDPLSAIADAARQLLTVATARVTAQATTHAARPATVKVKVAQVSVPPAAGADMNTPSIAVATASRQHDRLIVRSAIGDPVVLPFDVREVLYGSRSQVILTDGRRLVPGDSVEPWRLAEIRPGALVFEGPQKVLVPW